MARKENTPLWMFSFLVMNTSTEDEDPTERFIMTTNATEMEAKRTSKLDFTNGTITATVVLQKDGDVQLGDADGLADLIGGTLSELVANSVGDLVKGVQPASSLNSTRKHRSSYSISIGGYKVTLKLKVATAEHHAMPASTFADLTGAFFFTTSHYFLKQIETAQEAQEKIGFLSDLLGGFTSSLFDLAIRSGLFNDENTAKTKADAQVATN